MVAIGDYYAKRGQLVIEALKNSKHVICDKPICTELSELDEIERLAKEKNLQVCCMLDLRYMEQASKAKELVESGVIGEVKIATFTGQHGLSFDTRPRWYFEDGKHGGTINDIAIHGMDLVRFITGKNLTRIDCAKTWNAYAVKAPNFKDCGQFMVELENGAGFTGDVSYAAPASCGFSLETYWRMTFWGTKGVAEYKLKGGGKAGIDADDAALLQVALEGSDGFAPVKMKKYDATGLGEFVKEINGETDLLIDTAEVIRTSREVLTVQAAVR